MPVYLKMAHAPVIALTRPEIIACIKNLRCGDNSCVLGRFGMGTNGGCRCPPVMLRKNSTQQEWLAARTWTLRLARPTNQLMEAPE